MHLSLGLRRLPPAARRGRATLPQWHTCRLVSAAPPSPPPAALPPALTQTDLATSARVARLAGAAYIAEDGALGRALDDAGFSLVACGATFFTRWYAADAPPGALAPHAVRVVAARGVTWLAAGASTLRLWQALARAWPADFVGGVRAHAGVADLSADLAAAVGRCVRASPHPVLMTGHSLGGALSLLTAARLTGGRDADRAHALPPSVVTFGAPPVLSAAGAGDAALAALGLARVRSFVSAGDPVPRWLQQAEPVAAAAAAMPPIAAALRAFGLDGQAAPASPAGLFASVGDTYLLSWTPDAGVDVVPLPRGAAADAALAAAAPEGRTDADGGVRRALGFLLDHAHTSYADDLTAAANAAARRAAAA